MLLLQLLNTRLIAATCQYATEEFKLQQKEDNQM
jgi:hypothetical protein